MNKQKLIDNLCTVIADEVLREEAEVLAGMLEVLANNPDNIPILVATLPDDNPIFKSWFDEN